MMNTHEVTASHDNPILVTGSTGFIGPRVVGNLLDRGFLRIRCLARPTSNLGRLKHEIDSRGAADRVEILMRSLLSRDDCSEIGRGVPLIYHLAVAGTKAFSDAFLNSVVTTRNLLDAAIEGKRLRRFVNVSSFAVYTNRGKPKWRLLDETCPVETHPGTRAEAYCYAKVKQDELVVNYGKRFGVPYVIVRPGSVYGPGKDFISGRVGVDSFGLYLHFGGSNPIPFTHVDNCAEAIVLAGLKAGIEGEVFNVVDDNLPTSRRYLRLYKNNVRSFKSVYIPHALSYLFCWLWEEYARWSHDQLPPVFTRREWAATWKKTGFSNHKIKDLLGWKPLVPTGEGLSSYLESCRK